MSCTELQRHGEHEASPLPRDGVDFYVAAQVVHPSFHDVEADSPPRTRGDASRSREARVPDPRHHVARRHRRGFLGGRDAAADQRLANAFDVDAVAVVGELHVEHVPVELDAQHERRGAVLSSGYAVLRCFDAMVDGVVNEVNDGLA